MKKVTLSLKGKGITPHMLRLLSKFLSIKKSVISRPFVLRLPLSRSSLKLDASLRLRLTVFDSPSVIYILILCLVERITN